MAQRTVQSIGNPLNINHWLEKETIAGVVCKELANLEVANYGKHQSWEMLLNDPKLPKKIRLSEYEYVALSERLYDKFRWIMKRKK